MSTPEVRICYECLESLCHQLNRPLVLFSALEGRWRYSLNTDKQTAAMQIAKQAYSLALEQNNSALMIRAYRALAVTLYFLGDFETTRQYAMRGVQIWRSGGVQSPVEEISTPEVICQCYEAITAWHLGEITSCQATMIEAISLAKGLNDMHALAVALFLGAIVGHFERPPTQVERCASDLIELSTRQNFAMWLAAGKVLRGWAQSASGGTTEGLSRIEDGIEEWRASGSMWIVPYFLALKAEALHLADRTSEALEAIKEAEALVERSEERWWCAEVHRLRGVFLATLGADVAQIEASFCTAIRTAKEQKSVSLAARAEATYAQYLHQKAGVSGRHVFRLPLC
jgi:predicted ATPase